MTTLASMQSASQTAKPTWLDRVSFPVNLDDESRAMLAGLPVVNAPARKVLFRAGDSVCGFVMIVSGRVGVYLTGASGREILLYDITPGETCVQSTLGLLGSQDFMGEAVAETDVEMVVVPKATFDRLLDRSPAFRHFVFNAFGERFGAVMSLLERVAFVKIEERLASILLKRAGPDGIVRNTHQDLATAIGSAREVVSRRLEAFRRKGLVELDRGEIRIADGEGLQNLITTQDLD